MPDAERLAALIDGRLDERERADLLARLALSEEELAVLADAGAVTRELEEEDRAAAVGEGGADVIPLPPRRRATRYRQWMPIAAVLAGVAVGTGLWMADAGAAPVSPVAVVDHLASEDGPYVPLADPWDAARGPGALEPFARGVQLGVRLVDLQAAARSGDTAEVRITAHQVAGLLQGARLDDAAANFYDRVSKGQAAADPGDLERRAARVAKRAGSDAVALGAWARAARMAAERRDERYFRETRRVLRDLSPAPEGAPDEAVAALAGVRRDLAEGPPPAWNRLTGDLDRLLAAAAG